jgi:hypothetical protein
MVYSLLRGALLVRSPGDLRKCYGRTMADDGGSRVVSLRLEEVDDDGTLALA